MKKEELKDKVVSFLDGMINQWFDGTTMQENISRTVARTILIANRNKYDNYIDLVTDEHGNVLIDELLNNFNFEPIEIDLTKYSYLLPKKILIFGKEDYEQLKSILIKKG